LVRSEMNGGRASVSTNKVYGIANSSSSCSSSYMPTQSITDYLIIKGPLPGSSVFSPLFPVFLYCIFIISKMASRSAISYFSPIQSIPPHPTS